MLADTIDDGRCRKWTAGGTPSTNMLMFSFQSINNPCSHAKSGTDDSRFLFRDAKSPFAPPRRGQEVRTAVHVRPSCGGAPVQQLTSMSRPAEGKKKFGRGHTESFATDGSRRAHGHTGTRAHGHTGTRVPPRSTCRLRLDETRIVTWQAVEQWKLQAAWCLLPEEFAAVTPGRQASRVVALSHASRAARMNSRTINCDFRDGRERTSVTPVPSQVSAAGAGDASAGRRHRGRRRGREQTRASCEGAGGGSIHMIRAIGWSHCLRNGRHGRAMDASPAQRLPEVESHDTGRRGILNREGQAVSCDGRSTSKPSRITDPCGA
ncbi:hypothetical protein EJ04DRAFT_548397 [Polyplosphaeria fusca]|uniref:Uncharacterized protein n=1 Tax=Polyplosphaeria fusca TaxID=682080 RepID=A0A9P4RBC0_9PLEO|nr:hypothetical protein EJ04DRAFT_548397 [Polyplosphaeria fusca]